MFCGLFWLVNTMTEVIGACSRPVINPNSYSLTDDKASYAVNETYEIFCTPGYDPSGTGKLICGDGNSWSDEAPTCKSTKGAYPWWMLLVAVTVIIIMIACILPRFLQCFCSKSKKSKSDVEKGNERNNNGYDDEDSDDDDNRADSPVPDFSKSKKMTNLEFMAKLHKDADRKTMKRATKNAVF
ncbi:uncharacterized protein LOC128236878 [Mya arenaria]|uniref:uncharacterized protein LOC128236878 n=1 Tax=Mya arenaria TaxID=6604 RepID=UPI0022DFC201|nr:uncharacterized protein LOC128236878 [Mya arenaria]